MDNKIIEFPTIKAPTDKNTLANSIIRKCINSKKNISALNSILMGLAILLTDISQDTKKDNKNALNSTIDLFNKLYNAVIAKPEYKQIAVKMILELIMDIVND